MPWHAGIDENGLGPQLGPMLVTAVMARVSESARQGLRQDGTRFLHERLDDSKALVSHGKVALAEAWARAVAERCKIRASSPDALVEALALEQRHQRVSMCPDLGLTQCWSAEGEGFEADEAQVDAARQDLDLLDRRGIDVVWARSLIVCVRALNEARHNGCGRFESDLHAMERLILAARAEACQDIEVVCGKVGGLQRYVPAMSVLGDRLHTVLGEERACSSYGFPGVGIVHFRRDADGSDPLVALGSLVGKYLRELLMKRIVRFYQRQEPELPDASGYNDPVTARFVRATLARRRRLGIPDLCFRREQASDSKDE
ncbi:MAG: hypothetical protein HY898_07960 [Deltaproteobacteria bacterium]|nr:hypothetical protein [Deltaproteobacteria bacterium]